jgi:ATP-binding cassette subfamily B protein
LHQDVVHFPQGYQTLVGERGITLSGGQRQRLALARALLRDSPVLLLDDAFSSVDSATEAHIRQALQPLLRQRTVIVIAHRLSSIQDADRIFVLAEGRVAEAGTHAELLRRGGLYARLWQLQSLEAELERLS